MYIADVNSLCGIKFFMLRPYHTVQRFSGRLKLNVKLLVEVQSTMTSNYIDAAVYLCYINLVVVMVDCTSTCNFTLHLALNLPENLCTLANAVR